jgi:ACT domain
MVLAVLRVWLADRPGSLASVAGRIGAGGGDVVGIDVLERGGGRVIDEFVVELGDVASLDGIVSAVDDLEDVDVEVAELVPALPDPRLDALELAASLVSQTSAADLVSTLCDESRTRFACSWAAVVNRSTSATLAASGHAPHGRWLSAFVTGVSAGNGEGPVDVAWAPLGDTSLVLVLGRDQARIRDRERRQLVALAAIAATRLEQTNLASRPDPEPAALWVHPSWGDRRPG